MTRRTTTLGEVCRFVGGGTPSRKRPDYFTGSIPWVTVKDFKAFRLSDAEEHITEAAVQDSSVNVVEAGTVLLVTRVGLGKVAIADRPLAINQDIKGLTPSEDVLPEYLFWFLLSQARVIEGLGTGATVKGVTLQDVKAIKMAIPPLSEQRRIVNLLSRAERIVRLRREAQAKAQAIIPALFLDMFGDPATNPKGWKESPLRDLVQEFRYGTSNKSGATGLPALRIPNVIGNRLDPEDMKLVAVTEAEAARLRLIAGDLLFVRTNGNPDYVGRSAVFEPEVISAAGFDAANCIYASYLIRARLKPEAIRPGFLQAFLSSHEGRKRLREQARTSAGQYNINTEGLGCIHIPLPLMAMQTEFEGRCHAIQSIVVRQTDALQRAEATFQALLTRVFKYPTNCVVGARQQGKSLG